MHENCGLHLKSLCVLLKEVLGLKSSYSGVPCAVWGTESSAGQIACKGPFQPKLRLWLLWSDMPTCQALGDTVSSLCRCGKQSWDMTCPWRLRLRETTGTLTLISWWVSGVVIRNIGGGAVKGSLALDICWSTRPGLGVRHGMQHRWLCRISQVSPTPHRYCQVICLSHFWPIPMSPELPTSVYPTSDYK